MKVSDLARLAEVTTTPHQAAPPVVPIVRYTAEVPKPLHRHLKTFALENDTTTYAVTRALLTLLQTDPALAAQVVMLVREGDAAR
ncbi:MAG: hypothetical protein M0027_12105 [Candidatus Dormibacteraeota bacterium]|nr:hypothetical protein [Candidatus Dormibacteraeota bacterium]